MVGGLVTLGLIFLVFYFLLIRPQQKQQQKIQEMRNALRAGEKVITTGGIFGTVESIASDSVMLKIADKVRIEVAKNAIASIREETKKGGKE